MMLHITINGKPYILDTPPERRLIDLLREDLGLTGTKEGCGEGECGACTVLLNGEAAHACLALACQLEGAEVTTIEGLEKDGQLDPLQKAFIDEMAIQCGFCTAGMIMTLKALLYKNPDADEAAIRMAIAGNICRCSGYGQIVNAVKKAQRMEVAHDV